jgi:hypothetical protein
VGAAGGRAVGLPAASRGRVCAALLVLRDADRSRWRLAGRDSSTHSSQRVDTRQRVRARRRLVSSFWNPCWTARSVARRQCGKVCYVHTYVRRHGSLQGRPQPAQSSRTVYCARQETGVAGVQRARLLLWQSAPYAAAHPGLRLWELHSQQGSSPARALIAIPIPGHRPEQPASAAIAPSHASPVAHCPLPIAHRPSPRLQACPSRTATASQRVARVGTRQQNACAQGRGSDQIAVLRPGARYRSHCTTLGASGGLWGKFLTVAAPVGASTRTAGARRLRGAAASVESTRRSGR